MYGVLFGCCFPISATLFDLLRLGYSFTLLNLVEVQVLNPIHYIIDTAPFFLGLFALIAGRKQDQLVRTNIQLVKNSKIKEEFFANMSHEIRTPMNGVIGVVDLLIKTTDLTKIQTKYLDIISKSSDDMMTIINDILNISQLEANKVVIDYKTVSLRETLEHEVNLFRELALQKGIDIELDMDDDIPTYLKLGEIRLRQIVSNLLSNAIKFSEKGPIVIRARLINSEEASVVLKINVIDNGQGILASDIKLLFNVFQQLDQSSTKRVKGTGLGLSISKRLAELMGGEMGVVSERGKGSDFWFTLKAFKTINPKGKQVFDKQGMGSFKKKRILLVDDMELNIIVGEAILLQFGCTVDIARNGLEAVEKFKIQKYDLILMDIQMPKMDGLEATKEIRLLNVLTPPIIALSANAMEGDNEYYIKSGLDDYLSKPIVIETLKSLLNKWLDKCD